ncbi:NADH-quinone oxidoreductase subunit J [Motiliproteus sp. SC1-56]|uniref:NADH-quinone oxidoreductase subunit J n=1 Tax=Motiliproteus sp. SC1-56 TaxID=2799565 RepID=UPI001A8E9F73|nr:NADH-quinone oxidoreductase subunit J [Motiliproteus sp. SC1-56]
MSLLFYPAAAIALFATLMVITRVHAVHALLYLVVAQLAVALLFFLLGAPFAAALEVLVYAGAVMVMFIFVIMMLNLGRPTLLQERGWLPKGIWIGPGLLAGGLLAELLLVLSAGPALEPHWVPPQRVGAALFGPYLLAVELASLLLLAALVGAYHLARPYLRRADQDDTVEAER